MATTTTRTPQEERTRQMRARLLEATIECVVVRGFAGTSTTLVSERAGVSRGAQLHHFPSKSDLVLAAVEHLTVVRGAELAAAAEALPRGRRRTRAVLDMLAEHFTSPVFAAALELWVAARTDPELHAAVAPLEQRVGRDTHRIAVEALGVDEAEPRTSVTCCTAATTRSCLVGKWCSCAPRLTPARSLTSVVDVPA